MMMDFNRRKSVNKQPCRRLGFQSLLLLMSLSLANWVAGQGQESPSAELPVSPPSSDVRILIDISGSMKKNDPNNLRRPALNMLSRLIPDGSQSGVWTFGQYINMLVKHRLVDDEWREEALIKVNQINSVGKFTNIGEVLDKAAYDRSYTTSSAFDKHVILLTDGMVDIDRDPEVNTQEKQRILTDVLSSYRDANLTLHTIALSDNADRNLMERLALETDGKHAIAKNADELMAIFLDVFDQAVPSERLPLTGNTFLTDSSVEEFTALIFRESTSETTVLIGPDDTEYSKSTSNVDPNVNWFHTDEYDLITIQRPLEGEWRVIANIKPRSRITVVSDLSLIVKPLPTNVIVDDVVNLSFALKEDNKIVKRAEFLDLLTIDLSTVLSQDFDTGKSTQQWGGSNWSQRVSDNPMPGNGIFSESLRHLNQLGDYVLTINIDGKTFQRQYKHHFTVRMPAKVDIKQVDQSNTSIQVLPQLRALSNPKTQVVGKLASPDGTTTIVQFKRSVEQFWFFELDATKPSGNYALTLRVTYADDTGRLVDYIPDSLQFHHPKNDNPFDLLTEEEAPQLPQQESVVDAKPEMPPAEVVEEKPPSSTMIETQNEEAAEAKEQEPPENSALGKWLLYALLALVNALILIVIYVLYRKIFGSQEDKIEIPQKEAEIKHQEPIAKPDQDFSEPPMDEMSMDDLNEDIDLAKAETSDDELDKILSEADPLDEINDDLLGLEDPEDEDPEFSLDDFAPDLPDDEESSDEKDLK